MEITQSSICEDRAHIDLIAICSEIIEQLVYNLTS